MRRLSKSSPNRLSADALRLVSLAHGMAEAASRLEERHWENQLDLLLYKLLKAANQDAIDRALEHLFNANIAAYDALLEAVEAGSESCAVEYDDRHYHALLIAIPILAWTRFTIPSGPIPDEMRTVLSAHLHGHLLADDVCLALAPALFSIDQLPRTHSDTFALTQRMAQAAVKATPVKRLANQPETTPFLADTRYLLAAVAAPAGEPLFAWQARMQPEERATALAQWRAQAGPNIASLLPGCGTELLMPEAYYVACREADRQIRPASIRAAVNYLTQTLGMEAGALRAVIGAFSEEPLAGRLDEYRIGFTVRQDPEVIYGVVWPLYGQEDEEESDLSPTFEALTTPELLDAETRSPLEEITALLRACGISHIKRHSERFPLEFCDDCGSPLYPDPDGELVHAEMPEDAPAGPGHFH